MQSFQDLKVWQLAMDLAEDIYRATSDFPKHEIYALTNQLRRASVSVPSNIAEGTPAIQRRIFCTISRCREDPLQRLKLR